MNDRYDLDPVENIIYTEVIQKIDPLLCDYCIEHLLKQGAKTGSDRSAKTGKKSSTETVIENQSGSISSNGQGKKPAEITEIERQKQEQEQRKLDLKRGNSEVLPERHAVA